MSETKKTDTWAVAIAAVALIVSGLTWLDVREQVSLARGQIRSYVQVTDATLVQPITEASFIQLKLKLKNLGQTAAVNVYGEMDYGMGMPDPEGRGNDATRRPLGNMGPGLERTIILKSNRYNRFQWPTPSSRNYQTVYFYGTVWFTDDTTHERRKEDWCYELPLKSEALLKGTELEQCGILGYSSKP